MSVIEMTADEVRQYRDACDRDDMVARSPVPWISREAYHVCTTIIRTRRLQGDPDKVTVTFRHDGVQHLYELHYAVIP